MNRARMLKIIDAPHVMPDNTIVKIDSTNLPIVFIDTQGNTIEREEFITVYVKIVDNGKDGLNYGDTLVFSNQNVDYEGYMAIRHRGYSSYNATTKKSYAIRAIDTRKGGKKKKSKLLGMRKGKKWALKASSFDKSMIRDALTFELARPYMDFVPQTRFCEVIVDGIYCGVYSLSEQITADRLKIEKPNNTEIGGGYVLQIDNHHKDKGLPSKHWDITFLQEYPDSDKLSLNQIQYIYDYIDNVEKFVMNGGGVVFDRYIDMFSMIDYQLSSEFSHNADAYVFSTFFYKNHDDKDSKLKFSLWDFDLGYGNYSALDCSKTDTWVYEKQGHWWQEAMKNPMYAEAVKMRWRQYRDDVYSDEHINYVIDSLANVLTVYDAEKRNSDAWRPFADPWRKEVKPQKYIASSYEEEIAYLKDWISRRLKWMDKELLGEE